MRLARGIGVDGLIYFSGTGTTLDFHRGITRFFQERRKPSCKLGNIEPLIDVIVMTQTLSMIPPEMEKPSA